MPLCLRCLVLRLCLNTLSQVHCVLGSTFKVEAVFKLASFTFCWIFSYLSVHACSFLDCQGRVKTWSLFWSLLLLVHTPTLSISWHSWGVWDLMGWPCTCVLPLSQPGLCGGHQSSLQTVTLSSSSMALSFPESPLNF